VEALGRRVNDAAVWNHALANELVIVSKDGDFSERILLAQPPPWVVHLRIGNMRPWDFRAFLPRAWPQIESLIGEAVGLERFRGSHRGNDPIAN
jgi:predicted nuclease of predicted toxin-antitoxin system